MTLSEFAEEVKLVYPGVPPEPSVIAGDYGFYTGSPSHSIYVYYYCGVEMTQWYVSATEGGMPYGWGNTLDEARTMHELRQVKAI